MSRMQRGDCTDPLLHALELLGVALAELRSLAVSGDSVVSATFSPTIKGSGKRMRASAREALAIDALPDVLTARDLWDLLPLGRDAIYQRLNTGEIRAVRCGQKWLIPKDAVREFLGRCGE